MKPSRRTWRVRGVPISLDRVGLADALQAHPDLQCPETNTTENSDCDYVGNGASVHTLAPEFQLQDQVATVRFRCLPLCLAELEGKGQQVTISLQHPNHENRADDVRRTGKAIPAVKLTIDDHFDGITVLSAPTAEAHEFDVLAISGLGSHPFGSFVHKQDGHMWLSDSLPRDMPMARVMIYGYESGLQDSTSLAHIGDLAGPLSITLSSLLRSESKRRLILIGHSLGGLLIQEALIRIADSDVDSEVLDMLHGVLLFGVPNDGMAIESLIPMVNDQPNRFLVESLSAMNSQVLELQGRNFSEVLERASFELFCFYETDFSPTAALVRTTPIRYPLGTIC